MWLIGAKWDQRFMEGSVPVLSEELLGQLVAVEPESRRETGGLFWTEGYLSFWWMLSVWHSPDSGFHSSSGIKLLLGLCQTEK